MPELRLKRLRFSREADNWLRTLKARTGITPNLLCRLAFCLSVSESGAPSATLYPEDSDREINRYTLLGEYDAVFVALLRQRLMQDGSRNTESMDDQFRAHVHRGILLLAARLKSIADLEALVRGPVAAGSR